MSTHPLRIGVVFRETTLVVMLVETVQAEIDDELAVAAAVVIAVVVMDDGGDCCSAETGGGPDVVPARVETNVSISPDSTTCCLVMVRWLISNSVKRR